MINKYKIVFVIFFSLTLSCSAQTLSEKFEIDKTDDNVTFYQSRYLLEDPSQKLLDNKGLGYDKLYGLRNFRFVLNGVLYRGGGNNKYHSTDPRANMNPLPNSGLKNLCQEGFSKSIYLYSKNFSDSPEKVHCTSIHQKENELNYLNLLSSKTSDVEEILRVVHKTIISKSAPIYVHCWNGWHASGLVSALSLRQFCGWDGEQAVKYWDENTDGHNQSSSYEKMRKKIRDFTPISSLTIPNSSKNIICP